MIIIHHSVLVLSYRFIIIMEENESADILTAFCEPQKYMRASFSFDYPILILIIKNLYIINQDLPFPLYIVAIAKRSDGIWGLTLYN